MPNDVDNRIDRLRQRYRQDNNLDPIYAVVGNGAGVVQDTSIAGNVFVRELTSNGLSFAKSVRGPQNTMTLYDGLNVRLLRDERKQLYVASIDNQAQAASGGNAYLTSQPPQQRVRQDLIETLSVMPDNPPSLYLSVKAWNPIVNGTYYEFPGTRVYMGPYVPPTGSMTFASIFIKSDYLTGEVGTSTPRAVSDLPLDSVDVQETINHRSTGAVPVQTVKLIGGQTQITLTDIQNDGKALQQLVNVADSGGGGGGGSGSLTSIVAQNPLTGGTITTAGTIGLATSGVTPASYVNPTITVDSYGRVTAAAAGSGGPVVATQGTFYLETVLYDNTLSGAGNWDVSSIDQTYDHLRIILESRSSRAVGEDSGDIIFNNDTTAANYVMQQLYGQDASAGGGSGASFAPVYTTDTASVPNRFGTYDGLIQNYTGALHKNIQGWNFVPLGASGNYNIARFVTWKSTAAINRIAVRSSNGSSNNFEAGSRLQIIGIKQQVVVTSVTGIGPGQYILLQDQKAQNTDGGTFNSGAWQTRDLNTEVADEGNNCTLSSNQFALLAGTYRVRARAPAGFVGRHQIRLRNITDSTTPLTGTSEFTSQSATYAQTTSEIYGTFTIGTTKTFEIQHQCQVSAATNGFGVAANFGTEIYTSVELTKVG